jgi:hypothetical protein
MKSRGTSTLSTRYGVNENVYVCVLCEESSNTKYIGSIEKEVACRGV